MSAAACNCNQNEKMKLFMDVTQYGFAISDVTLFLDTHPKDQEALDYFRHMSRKYEKAVAEYESKFGPLTKKGEEDQNCWQWAMTPWPWERGYF